MYCNAKHRPFQPLVLGVVSALLLPLLAACGGTQSLPTLSPTHTRAPTPMTTPTLPLTRAVTPPPVTTASPDSIRLTTTVIKEAPDGSFSAVEGGGQMVSFYDRFGVYFKPEQEVHVYVLHQQATGDVDVLFPAYGNSEQANPVPADKEVWVPGNFDRWFTLDGNEGVERILVVAGPKPLPLLEDMPAGEMAAMENFFTAPNSPAAGIMGGVGEVVEPPNDLVLSLVESMEPGVSVPSRAPLVLPDGRELDVDIVTLEVAGGASLLYAVEFDHVNPEHNVKISEPEEGSVVEGVVNVTVDVTGNPEPDKVTLSVDGVVIGVAESAPYSVEWHTGGIPDGEHRLIAHVERMATAVDPLIRWLGGGMGSVTNVWVANGTGGEIVAYTDSREFFLKTGADLLIGPDFPERLPCKPCHEFTLPYMRFVSSSGEFRLIPGNIGFRALETERVPEVGNPQVIDSPLQILFEKKIDAAYLTLEGSGSQISGIPPAVSVTARDHAGGVYTVVLSWEKPGSKFVGFSSPHGLLGLTLADATPFEAHPFTIQSAAALAK